MLIERMNEMAATLVQTGTTKTVAGGKSREAGAARIMGAALSPPLRQEALPAPV